MATYKWNGQHWVDKATGERMAVSGEIAAPMIMKAMPEYISPASGKLITDRAQRREDLKATGCVEWQGGKKRGFGNPAFCKKHNLPLCEEAANRKKPKYIDPLADFRKG